MLIRIFRLGLLVTLLSLAACDDDTASPEGTIEVDVLFHLNVDGAPVQLNLSAQTYTNPSGTKYGIKEVRFILSNVRLHNDEGGSFLLKDIHYYDIKEAGTQAIHASGLPHANYTAVSFTFGLDETRNLRNQYPAIPDIMVWPTGMGAELGYHYMQIEGNFEFTPGGATGGYTTHTGAHHLSTDVTAHHYHFQINAPFTPVHIHEGGHGELEISIDLNGWYLDHAPADGVDTQYDFATLPNQMVMGDPDAQGKLQANGPECFSATMTVEGGHDH